MDTATAFNTLWEAACRAELNMADSQKVLKAYGVLAPCFAQQNGETNDQTQIPDSTQNA